MFFHSKSPLMKVGGDFLYLFSKVGKRASLFLYLYFLNIVYSFFVLVEFLKFLESGIERSLILCLKVFANYRFFEERHRKKVDDE